ncbi:hypothetical protein [Salipiger mucosus]|uniref:Uncharacterized protein n=1 Tax=Salipiger mucosus DSM 16094 TaxID=1123237 RepID=S9QG48_9RHOB|nr:hypothetical protein [Salipiger mucosus]EPX80411.1 hypothetical protein Salmuc_03727 [Salipiger mucosus DSM 16094]
MARKMYGVVLWIDRMAPKAVIWCEDQGDLALCEEEDLAGPAEALPEAGDLVAFDVSQEAGLRRARNPEPLIARRFDGLGAARQGFRPDAVRPAAQPA